MSQRPEVPAPETSLEAWLRQLTISLWFRTSGQEESLALADEWTDRTSPRSAGVIGRSDRQEYGGLQHERRDRDRMWNLPDEVSFGRNHGWQMRQLRGYDWITWIPPRLGCQMSGAHRTYVASHLCDVREWDTGLLRLRATDRPGTFDEVSPRHLFHAVAELRPDDLPIPWEEFALAFRVRRPCSSTKTLVTTAEARRCGAR